MMRNKKVFDIIVTGFVILNCISGIGVDVCADSHSSSNARRHYVAKYTFSELGL